MDNKKPKTELADGLPITDDHRELKSNGQQKGYIVLTKEEREKGLVRPVRDSYIHIGLTPTNPLLDLTDEEKKQYSDCGYVKFEKYPRSESSSVVGRFWTQEQLNSGCNTNSKMASAIAETYARDPKFYGSTFCCQCGSHFSVKEFIWKGTNERVGS